MHRRSGCTIFGEITRINRKAPPIKKPDTRKHWQRLSRKEISRSGHMTNNPISDIGMISCRNDHCPTNKPLTMLKKYGVTYKDRNGCDQILNFESTDYSTFKNKYDTGNEENMRKFNEIYHQCVYYKAKAHKILAHRLEFGHIGYLEEILVDGDQKLCCPYCGTTDVVMDIIERKDSDWTSDAMPEHTNSKVKVKQRHPYTKEWVTVEVDVAPNPECDGKSYLDDHFKNKDYDLIRDQRKEAKEEGVYDNTYYVPLKPELPSVWPLRCFKFKRKHKRSIDHTLNPYIRDMISKDISVESHMYDGEPTPHFKFYHR